MKDFDYCAVNSLEEVADILKADDGRTRIVAGGTDLVTVLKAGILPVHPEVLVDIGAIPDLGRIYEKDGVLHIGTMAKLSTIANDGLIMNRAPALAETADRVASPQIRNMGTLGGNLCQETRCWYYRYPDRLGGGAIMCPRKSSKGASCLAVRGDNRYHAILGARRCFAVCPSDTAVTLAVLEAEIVIMGSEGIRRVAVKDFYSPLSNALRCGELVLGVEIPCANSLVGQSFVKFTLRASIDFAVVSAAAAIELKDGICRNARLALGAVAPGPYSSEAARLSLIGNVIDEQAASTAADLALENALPLSMNAYKIDIAKAILKQAILDAAVKCKE